MKLMMFDFECGKCGHTFEELVKSTVKSQKCPECSGRASRCVSMGHLDYLHMGVDTALGTAADKWAKMQWQKARSDKGSRRDGAPNLKMY